MRRHLSIALAQLNPTVGDLAGNAQRAFEAWQTARQGAADLVLFPELFITGYPPEDLILKPAFQEAAMVAVRALAQRCSEAGEGPALLMGTPWRQDGAVFNAVALLEAGQVAALRYKVDLPNYGVFDEKRVFRAGPPPAPITFRGVRLGVPVCEDIWTPAVTAGLAQAGTDLFLVANGSPFSRRKYGERLRRARARVTESGRPLVYVNQLGGQDELVFDGASFVLNPDASLAAQLPAWREAVVVTRWQSGAAGWTAAPGPHEAPADGETEAAWYQACVLGLRDYVEKNRFPGVVLGLSGGIDSALVAAIAVDALGAERVHCVMLPYTYTSDASLRDAQDCARLLGVAYDTVPIHGPVAAVTEALAEMFAGRDADVTEENIQSRLRGLILMAISNKLGALVITTGNKSEMSVGYATLYGDMNGGFNPIKDLYKTQVFALARWRNAHRPEIGRGPTGEVIPENIIHKPPTAELRAGQTDQDSLPPYEVLDDILHALVEEELSVREIVERGHEADLVRRVAHLLYVAEYKRRQAAPGVKISERDFGRDRRYPITNRFREEG